MAVDAFLKLELKGESKVKGHEEEIEILSWSWGLTQQGTMHRGSGGGAGKVSVEDMTFTKFVDAASPGIALACCNGKHFPEATLTVRKAGEQPLDYLVITMTDVLVSAVQSGGNKGDDLPVETFSLNFAKFKEAYQKQDAKGGKAGGAIEVEYDVAANA
jgi:type VI secretion system secreted protein Hcp